MSKLMKVKRWVLLADAAKYLSTVLEEPVSIRDIYAIALEGNITLSFGMPRDLLANPIRICESKAERDAAVATQEWELLPVLKAGPNAIFSASETREGIFDFAMLGGDIELFRYNALSQAGDSFNCLTFDEIIARDEAGNLLRPLSRLWAADKFGIMQVAEEIPWYGSLPDEAQICVRVSELDRLIRSLAVDSGLGAVPADVQLAQDVVSSHPESHAASIDSVAGTPPYLNPLHPRFPYRLAAAVQAWEAVKNVEGQGVVGVLEAWLREHAVELGLTTRDGKPSKQAIEDTARVANWRRDGGAPKTPSAGRGSDV